MKGLLRRVGGIGGLIALARSPIGRRIQREVTAAIRRRRQTGTARPPRR